ncbi:SMI1/KNR4 family protein [Sphingosinicella sp. BN140058]|uniref:SMI1/KNR4 family protein n=1 Tax=Sphingosinicella sp. BN140058 TaxID=1892855 RepID=UPI00101274F1|nr:SMI1/KNR4 family protein [Sphingosinicella sp. BN140058]QAY75999.1 hypothetical protein ETR14_05250 [Sphingosinicella sp. BN140058]
MRILASGMDMLPWDAADGPAPAPVPPGTIVRDLAARGVAAPPGYAEYAAANGGKRFPSGRNFVRGKMGGEPIGLATVLHFDPRQPRRWAADIWEQTEDELGPKLIPIATTYHAGLVCLDYRRGESPGVVSFDFEAMAGRKILVLADSFEDFLFRIGPRDAPD